MQWYTTGEGTSAALTPEPDDVYYGFGGASISSMLYKYTTVTFIRVHSTREALRV